MVHPSYRFLVIIFLMMNLPLSMMATIGIQTFVNPSEGASDGSITILAEGDTGPFVVMVSGPVSETQNGSGEFIFENLSPGTYYILVSDSDGCEKMMMLELEEGCLHLEIIELTYVTECSDGPSPCSTIDSNCTNDGIIEIRTEPSQEFTASWKDSQGNSYEGKRIEGLKPGVYNVTVTSNSGCTASIEGIAVGVCNDVYYDPFSGYCDNIELADNIRTESQDISKFGAKNGVIHLLNIYHPVEYILEHNESSFSQSGVASGPIVFENLAPGLYNLEVNTQGCTSANRVFRIIICDIIIISDVTFFSQCSDNVDNSNYCKGKTYIGGTIGSNKESRPIKVEGGFSNGGSYAYVFSREGDANSVYNYQGWFDSACPGTYTVIAVDKYQCASAPVVISIPDSPGQFERRFIRVWSTPSSFYCRGYPGYRSFPSSVIQAEFGIYCVRGEELKLMFKETYVVEAICNRNNDVDFQILQKEYEDYNIFGGYRGMNDVVHFHPEFGTFSCGALTDTRCPNNTHCRGKVLLQQPWFGHFEVVGDLVVTLDERNYGSLEKKINVEVVDGVPLCICTVYCKYDTQDPRPIYHSICGSPTYVGSKWGFDGCERHVYRCGGNDYVEVKGDCLVFPPDFVDEDQEDCEDVDDDDICDQTDNCIDVDKDRICDHEDNCIDTNNNLICDENEDLEDEEELDPDVDYENDGFFCDPSLLSYSQGGGSRFCIEVRPRCPNTQIQISLSANGVVYSSSGSASEPTLVSSTCWENNCFRFPNGARAQVAINWRVNGGWKLLVKLPGFFLVSERTCFTSESQYLSIKDSDIDINTLDRPRILNEGMNVDRGLLDLNHTGIPTLETSIVPNPFSESFNLIIGNVQKSQDLQYQIFDSFGKLVDRQTISIEVGNNEIEITNLADRPSGVYTLVVRSNEGEFRTLRLVKVY